VLAACLALPSAAHAGTAYVTGAPGAEVLHYDGAPGESSRVEISRLVSASAISIGESTANSIAAGAGCTGRSSHRVQCRGDVVEIDVSLGDGNDHLDAAGTPALLVPVHVSGGSGDDVLVGDTSGADVVDGGPDNDAVSWSESGADDYRGGDGTDAITLTGLSSRTVSLDDLANDGAPGAATANVHSDFEKVVSGANQTTLIGTSGPDQLEAPAGRAVLQGGGGDDRLNAGDDRCGGDGRDEVFGGDGDDTITIRSEGLADGGPGNDSIRAGLGCGGTTVTGGDGRDTVDLRSTYAGVLVSLDGVANDGLPEFNRFADNVSRDVERVIGTHYDDKLIGSDRGGRLDGEEGDDILDGAGGADVLMGGPGVDAVDYSSRTAGVTVDLDGQPSDDGEAGEGDTVGNDVEDVWGGAGDDRLIGNGLDNVLDGGPGADRMSGLAGEDLVDYSSRTAPVTVDLDGETADDGEAGEGDTVDADVEDIRGGAGGDQLTGNGRDNRLVGDGGDDVLDGRGGADSLFGGAGDDRLTTRDAFPDSAECGDGADAVTADASDTIAGDCETVDRAAVSASSAAGPVTVSLPRPEPQLPQRTPLVTTKAADTKAPVTTAKVASRVALARLLKSGLRASATCSEACNVAGTLRLDRRTAKRLKLPVVIGSGRAGSLKPGTVRFTVKLTPRARRALARHRPRSLRLTLSIVARDAARNARHLSKHLTVRR
jgi:Ca2+-binding RTX toxin-like protein